MTDTVDRPVTTTIDPRIRARRIAVQRDEGRKRLRRLVLGTGGVVIAVGLWGLTRTPLLDVDHVRVAGAHRSGAAAVAAAAGIEAGDALLTTDVGAAAERIAALPWVQTVDVSRKWPGTVEIAVVERQAAAAVPAKVAGGEPARWILVDASGRQLEVVPDPGPGVLRIEVPPVSPETGALLGKGADAVLELASGRPAALQDRLLAMRPAPGGAVEATVRLPNDLLATVRFGRPTQASVKWLALLTVLEGAEPAGLQVIDVRVPSAPALTRR